MIRKRIVVLVMFFLVLIVLFVLFNNGIFNQREENTQNEVIFYANSEIMEENSIFQNVVTLTWNTEDFITLIYPNGEKVENVNKPLTLSMNGQYTIKLNKITKKFKIEEMKVTDWEYNQKTRTIKFNNKENIVSATLAAELDDGTIFEGSLFDYIGKDVSEYTFPEKGYFEIQIETPGVKHSPIVINNE